MDRRETASGRDLLTEPPPSSWEIASQPTHLRQRLLALHAIESPRGWKHTSDHAPVIIDDRTTIGLKSGLSLLCGPAFARLGGQPRLAQFLKGRQPPAAPALTLFRRPFRGPGLHQFLQQRRPP